MSKTTKNKSVIKELREIRNKISLEIMNMTKDEIKAYFENKRTLHPTMYKTE